MAFDDCARKGRAEKRRKKKAPNQGPQYGADATEKWISGYWVLGNRALSNGVSKYTDRQQRAVQSIVSKCESVKGPTRLND